MLHWQEDLVSTLGMQMTEDEVFDRVSVAAKALGFSYCAFGLKIPYPFCGMKVAMRNDYPTEWRDRYDAAGYLRRDPTVLHCSSTQEPVVWSEEVFSTACAMWREAQDCGLRVGWAQSNLDVCGATSMITLARSHDALSSSELSAKEPQMRWLVSVAHVLLAQNICTSSVCEEACRLTHREIEILKWTADGKTAADIADILSIATDTVNFHVKKVVAKLGVANKTAAVARAIVVGLLR